METLHSPNSDVFKFAVFDEVSFAMLANVANKLYLYRGITPKVWKELLAAESKGRYFNVQIKDRYQTTELNSLDIVK
jgi:hypothetical protein